MTAREDGPAQARLGPFAFGLPDAVFATCDTGERVLASPAWTAYTGMSGADSLGFGWIEAIHPEDRDSALASWANAAPGGFYAAEYRIWQAANSMYRWNLTRAARMPGSPGQPAGWAGSSVDVHDLVQLRILVEGVPHLLWRSCDRGNWTWASPQWIGYTGLSQEESCGRGWLAAVHPDDRPATLQAWQAAAAHGTLDVEFRVCRAADGAYVWHRTRSLPVRDATGRILEWLGSTTDIQDLKDHGRALEEEIRTRKRVEARLSYIAFHDDLTGLRSRAFLMDHLAQSLDHANKGLAPGCAVLFLDLDRFKLVNDSLGHLAGDGLLVEVARRLMACVGPDDILSRLGGDEFAILVEGYDAASSAISLAECIIKEMRQPFVVGTREMFSSCSIGIAVSNRHGTPEALLRDADIAMYFAKRNDAGGYAVFAPSMRESAVEALALRTDLHNAVARNEFVLYYQPICNAQTKAIVGIEALIRWNHPERGLISPSVFISVAEESGLIRKIGQWVLREACTTLSDLRHRFPELDLHVSVNASAEELKDPQFIEDVEATLASTSVDAKSLQFEITESIFIKQPDAVGEILRRLRKLGVQIALDDFGTGYSSLSYLDSYDINTIKIDRSFVSRMLNQPRTMAIVETMARLARTMKLDVVAEGVEDDAQLSRLQEAGCSYVQGYLLGYPMPPDMFAAAVARQLDSRP